MFPPKSNQHISAVSFPQMDARISLLYKYGLNLRSRCHFDFILIRLLAIVKMKYFIVLAFVCCVIELSEV